MNATQIAHEIEQLPIEGQQQIEEFIASIKSRYSITNKTNLSFDETAWDEQIENDAQAGKLDALAAEALAEYHNGTT